MNINFLPYCSITIMRPRFQGNYCKRSSIRSLRQPFTTAIEAVRAVYAMQSQPENLDPVSDEPETMQMDETVEETIDSHDDVVDAVSPQEVESVPIRRGIQPNPQPSEIAGMPFVNLNVMKLRSFDVLYQWFASYCLPNQHAELKYGCGVAAT